MPRQPTGDAAAPPLLSLVLGEERHIVTARQRARQIAALLGFEPQDQVRIATAVSEIARNAFRYAGGGRIEFGLEGQVAPQLLTIAVSDHGPGFANLEEVLAGRYHSRTGLGLGIVGTRRLMDQFAVRSIPGDGSVVTMGKLLPSSAPLVGASQLRDITAALASDRPRTATEEVQEQNRELLRALDELRARQDELEHLNSELQDTNRGVVALYAELDEKADHLRRADQMKSRFLSNMSHEFRTPLNSILALTRLLLDRRDGALTTEQDYQVTLVRKAAQDLADLVNDLLDLAKVEAGKIVVRPTEFEADKLFGALRGMLRPLLVSDTVTLLFDEPVGIPPLYTDEAKVSQILRNFVSNALKFTERGEVKVSATYDSEAGTVAFAVSDTGIGIAPEDQERIFQEFTQVEHPVQRRVRGTGLGLPLSRKFANLLGGDLTVSSTPGLGSTFTAVIPAVYGARGLEAPEEPAAILAYDSSRVPVLAVEDSPESLLFYESAFQDSPYQLVPARTIREARQALRQLWARPAAILLDIVLQNEDTWRFLSELKANDATADVPVIVISAVDDARKGLALGAEAYAVKPVEGSWLLATLRRLECRSTRTVLLVDDDAAARYVLRRHLEPGGWAIMEAENGAIGLRLARESLPAAIVLDLVMPEMDGREVLAALRADTTTRDIPVVIATSKTLSPEEAQALTPRVPVLRKDLLALETAADHVDEALRNAGVPERGRAR